MATFAEIAQAAAAAAAAAAEAERVAAEATLVTAAETRLQGFLGSTPEPMMQCHIDLTKQLVVFQDGAGTCLSVTAGLHVRLVELGADGKWTDLTGPLTSVAALADALADA